jgi:uncharacterized protein (TIGR02145 family)
MALTITATGSEISTEKYLVTATSDDVLTTSVLMEVFINSNNIEHTLEHLPDFGTTDEFSFEINSIVKDYFENDFLPLTGANQTARLNALVGFRFYEVFSGVVQVTSYSSNVIIKNATQDVFEIEDFDIADYNCGDTGSSSSKLLTSQPSTIPVGDLTSVFLSCLTASYSGVAPTLTPKQEWTVETYLNGVLVTQTTEALDVPNRTIPNAPSGNKHDISNYRFDFDSSGGYDEVRIYVRDIASPFTQRSETKIFKLNDSCEKDITLSWYNELGGQDTFTFLGNITRTGKYTDSTFKKTRPVNPLSTDVGDLVYKSGYNYEYELFSDRMPENTVQWLSKILINKRAAIQTKASGVSASELGLLYNWFAVDQGNGGDGTASGGIVNPTQTGWSVPATGDFNTLKTFVTSDGGALKQTGLSNWDSPNSGATNSAKFNAVGGGLRGAVGGFGALKLTGNFMTYADLGTTYAGWFLSYNNTAISATSFLHEYGSSIRLFRAAVGGENDGDLIQGAYVGNNGVSYDGIVIGSQVWINRNLYETKFNDGTDIPNVTDDTDWNNLTTGALCVYNNAALSLPKSSKYFPIVITTDETVLEDKFTPETIFGIKFRMANRRKGLK